MPPVNSRCPFVFVFNFLNKSNRKTLSKCLVDGTPSAAGQRHTGTLQSIYSDLIPFINTKGTAIVEPDVYRVVRNEASQTLEVLK